MKIDVNEKGAVSSGISRELQLVANLKNGSAISRFCIRRVFCVLNFILRGTEGYDTISFIFQPNS